MIVVKKYEWDTTHTHKKYVIYNFAVYTHAVTHLVGTRMFALYFASDQYTKYRILLNNHFPPISAHHLNGVAVGKGVQAHGTGVLPAQEVGPDLILRVGVVNTQVLNPRGKPFVEPEVGPPLHGHLRSRESHVTVHRAVLYTGTEEVVHNQNSIIARPH